MGARHLTLKDRKELAKLYKSGCAISEIAEKLNVHRATVYKELRLGGTGKMDENGRIGYDANKAQQETINNYQRRRVTAGVVE